MDEKAFDSYKQARERIASGKERAFSLGIGLHPQSGPFLLLAMPSNMARVEGEVTEILFSVDEIQALNELLMRGSMGLLKAAIANMTGVVGDCLQGEIPNSPSELSH